MQQSKIFRKFESKENYKRKTINCRRNMLTSQKKRKNDKLNLLLLKSNLIVKYNLIMNRKQLFGL